MGLLDPLQSETVVAKVLHLTSRLLSPMCLICASMTAAGALRRAPHSMNPSEMGSPRSGAFSAAWCTASVNCQQTIGQEACLTTLLPTTSTTTSSTSCPVHFVCYSSYLSCPPPHPSAAHDVLPLTSRSGTTAGTSHPSFTVPGAQAIPVPGSSAVAILPHRSSSVTGVLPPGLPVIASAVGSYASDSALAQGEPCLARAGAA